MPSCDRSVVGQEEYLIEHNEKYAKIIEYYNHTPSWPASGSDAKCTSAPFERAQALEGAPAQLVGANFKKKIRPRPPWVSAVSC